jgi:thiamine biosynthesis lipoprotein
LLRLLIAAASVALAGCAVLAPPREVLLQGETMGSAWTVKVAGNLPLPRADLQAGVQARFEAVNQALSTYRADSALRVFNDDTSGEWIAIDPELAAVMGYARSLAPRSGGAYDLTVGPLVDLWGFGPDPASKQVPDVAAISAARARVGWQKLEVDLERSRARKSADVRVDLSSLGKGRGVDRVAEYLDSAGVENYLIDLSGKLRARGRNASGDPWRVAVERPSADNLADAAGFAVVTLHDASIATAGDYRRYFEAGNRHYSHIIDPRSGFPVDHAGLSATVMAATCMEADALATVLMVMAPQDAIRLADADHIPALLIAREGEGEGGGDGKGVRLTSSARWLALPGL